MSLYNYLPNKGLIAGAPSTMECLGISVLKGEERISQKISQWLQLLGCESRQWKIESGFHHGGYGKASQELMMFMRDFEQGNQLLLDPVYTAKLLWGIQQLAVNGYWKKGSHIVVLHSGGLQGRRGFGLSMT